ncbi:MAG: hypothetical protein KKD63_04815 [Proteobacteria bacterium]|nr:hypothetical protein [Desulfobulbaceae bacterium]MBU4152183.1 hypothetical protein [Pseudomonadota bacterium]
MRSCNYVYLIVIFVVGVLLTSSCVPGKEVGDIQATRRAEIKRIKTKEILASVGRENERLLADNAEQATTVIRQQQKIVRLEKDLEEVAAILAQAKPRGQDDDHDWSAMVAYYKDHVQGYEECVQLNAELKRRLKVLAVERHHDLSTLAELRKELQVWQNKDRYAITPGEGVKEHGSVVLEKGKQGDRLPEEQSDSSPEKEVDQQGQRSQEASLDEEPVVALLESVVTQWGQAWSEQKVDEYLSFYSVNFQQSEVNGRSAWEKLRRSRLTKPKSIRVSLADIKVQLVDSTTSRINFVQSYESNTYSDTVCKIIEMKKEDGDWKIVREGVE